MSTIQEIEQAVQRLDLANLAAFPDWFLAFDADALDQQIADDLAAGRLDDLISEAKNDLRSGRCTER